jgi:hypothetical protein
MPLSPRCNAPHAPDVPKPALPQRKTNYTTCWQTIAQSNKRYAVTLAMSFRLSDRFAHSPTVNGNESNERT